MERLNRIQEILNTSTVDEGIKFDKVEEGETVVGKVTNEAVKELYCRVIQTHSEIELIEQTHFSDLNELEWAELKKRAAILLNRKEMLSHMFWYHIRADFDLFDKEMVGIREGWQIVHFEDKCSGCPALMGDIPDFTIIIG